MYDPDRIPRPEKEMLEERVRQLEGRTLDQVWYREVDFQGSEEERKAKGLPLWQQGDDFEKVFSNFYLVTGETTFRFECTGGMRMAGLDVSSDPEMLLDAADEYGLLNDVSAASGWQPFVGGCIAEARLFWPWVDYEIGYWQSPRDLALTFEDGRTVYVSTGVLGDEGYEMEQLGTVFDEEAARKYGVGPHFAPDPPPEEAVYIPSEAPASWVVDALSAGGLKGQSVQQVWRGKSEPRERTTSRWREQTMPDVPTGYEVIPRRLYLATDEHMFYLSWGTAPRYGVWAGRNYMGDDVELEDLSEETPWNRLVGQRIDDVRCYWRTHDDGKAQLCIPRDLEVVMEDGYRLYLSAADPRKHEEDIGYLHQLTAYHGERAAWQFQIGPFADGARPTGPA